MYVHIYDIMSFVIDLNSKSNVLLFNILEKSFFIFLCLVAVSSPPKLEIKSDVLPAKIQYHLDDPNVTARPIKVSEKRNKSKRSRSMSSDSSKSSRSSGSSRSRSRSADRSETEEQRKETEKKKIEV